MSVDDFLGGGFMGSDGEGEEVSVWSFWQRAVVSNMHI